MTFMKHIFLTFLLIIWFWILFIILVTLKYGKQENLTTYFFDYAMPYINKTQYKKKNGPKAASSPWRKVTSELIGTTEA